LRFKEELVKMFPPRQLSHPTLETSVSVGVFERLLDFFSTLMNRWENSIFHNLFLQAKNNP
jgi:hypothetical protein